MLSLYDAYCAVVEKDPVVSKEVPSEDPSMLVVDEGSNGLVNPVDPVNSTLVLLSLLEEDKELSVYFSVEVTVLSKDVLSVVLIFPKDVVASVETPVSVDDDSIVEPEEPSGLSLARLLVVPERNRFIKKPYCCK